MLHHMLRAAAQRAFSTLDPYFKYVTMLLHGDGSALGSDTVTPFNSDASTNNFNITINGDARSNNFNPYQEGYYSNYFDGSGDTLNTASNAAFGFGSGAWTFEAWVYPTVAQTDNWIIATNDSGKLRMRVGASGYLSFYTDTGSIGLNSTTVVTVNAWSHVAICYDGTTLSLFQNGTRTATSTVSISNGSANACYIGSNTVGGGYWNGYISNARVVKGSAVYSGATYTVPTTPLSAISGTSLLTCQSNRFIDNSTNAFTITKNGDTAVSPAQPFTLPSSVATYGSAYLDGTGDYLTTPSSASISNFSGDFTIEGWVYLNATTAYGVLIGGSGSSGWYVEYGSARGFGAYDGSTFLNGSSTAVTNQWVNFAVTRASGTVRFFINGTLTASSSSANFNVTQSLGIGAYSGGSSSLNGYLSNLRINNTSALYTASYTPSTTPLTAISGTSLLTTQYNGGGNNSGFKDSSQNNFTITRNGNTTQGTFTPYGSNWSNYFANSPTGTSGIYVPDNAAFTFGSGDFTVEAWINSTYTRGGSANAGVVYSQCANIANNNNRSHGIQITDTSLLFYYTTNGSTDQTVTWSTTFNLNTWYHIAIARSGNTIYAFVNGVLLSSQSFTATIFDSSASLAIGSFGRYPVDDGYTSLTFPGYISNFRIVKGTALYTASFTPSTTPLTAVTNTSLLTCQSNRFVDNSTNNLAITTTGSPSVQRFSPFSPTTAYSTSVIGGSGYFDGSGDYLGFPNNTAFDFSTGDFTVEAWVYRVGTGSGSQVYEAIIGGNTSGVSYWTLYVNSSNNTVVWFGNDSTLRSTSNTITNNTWNHVAVSRSSGTLKIFINGVQGYSASVSTSYSLGSGGGGIGLDSASTGNKYFYGYINDTRVVKGTALYTSAFTPPTAPLTAVSGTSLLTNFTNAGILDNAMMNDLETVGNAQISTSVKKYGTGSMYFDGTGDSLYVPSTPNLTLGSGDFTVEMWVNPSSISGTLTFLLGMRPATTNGAYPVLYADNTGTYWYVSSANRISGGVLSTSTWTHLAIARSGTSTKMFINGTQTGSTYTDSTNYLMGRLYIGASDYNSGSSEYLSGYIDDLRITKGVARYTTNFTAPTAAFPNN